MAECSKTPQDMFTLFKICTTDELCVMMMNVQIRQNLSYHLDATWPMTNRGPIAELAGLAQQMTGLNELLRNVDAYDPSLRKCFECIPDHFTLRMLKFA